MQVNQHDNILLLGGDITVKTVTAATYRQFEQTCLKPEITELDLAGVQRADSACLSLLLAALRLKKQQIRLNNLPPSVIMLAGLYEIQDWINA